MTEYIDRHEAVVVVSRPALSRAELRRFICQIPAADVVEVIRCKDCKHFEQAECPWDDESFLIMANDYCSRGERKEA